ncbi:MFS transporter [Robbsia sp. KACC 23696]|uniref:MFS transporter n=1 Tax=Robbsia sp. KACC 23696 TaxID=3149231 RepID=UPI00325AE659
MALVLAGNRARSRGGVGRTLIATSFGFIVVQLDVTIVNVALPQIGTALGSGIGALQWIVDAYTLAFASCLLTAGATADRFGSRAVFIVGLTVFGAASLGCACAPTMACLIVARTLQGLAAALILPTSLSLLSHACADDAAARARAIGWWTAIGGAVSAVGPVAGGLLSTAFGWRAIFLVNVPVCAAGLWLTFRHVRETVPVAERRLDGAGQALSVVALFLMTHAVIEAGAKGWNAGAVWIGFAGAAVAGVLFLVNEACVSTPMIPLSLFANKALSASVLLGFISNLTFYGLVFVLGLYFQRVKHYSPIQTGLALAPFTVIMLANMASGHLTRRFGAKALTVAGSLLCASSFMLLHGIGPQTPYVLIFPSLILLAVGSGISTPAMTAAILDNVDASRAATASAIFNAARQIGSAMGVALFGATLLGSAATMTAGAVRAFDVSAMLRVLSAAFALAC